MLLTQSFHIEPAVILLLALIVLSIVCSVCYYIYLLKREKRVLLSVIEQKTKVLDYVNSEVKKLTIELVALEEVQYTNLNIFKLQPVNGNSQLVAFRYEKYLLEQFDSRCFLDGVKISRSAMLRLVVDNFITTSKPVN